MLQNSRLQPEAELFIPDSNLTNPDDEEDHFEHSNENSTIPQADPQATVPDRSKLETLKVPATEDTEYPVGDVGLIGDSLHLDQIVTHNGDDSDTVSKSIDLEVKSEGDDVSQL